jgi:hypothetical protein
MFIECVDRHVCVSESTLLLCVALVFCILLRPQFPYLCFGGGEFLAGNVRMVLCNSYVQREAAVQ